MIFSQSHGAAASISPAPPFRDHPLKLKAAAVDQKLVGIPDDVIDVLNSAAGAVGEQIPEQRFALFQFNLPEIVAVQMEQIENVVNERARLLSA